MRILLDECLPRQLVAELREHTVDTAQKSGWAGLKNGKLLEKASGKYEILLTIDKRIGHEQKIPGDVAVVTVRARSNRIQDLSAHTTGGGLLRQPDKQKLARIPGIMDVKLIIEEFVDHLACHLAK